MKDRWNQKDQGGIRLCKAVELEQKWSLNCLQLVAAACTLAKLRTGRSQGDTSLALKQTLAKGILTWSNGRLPCQKTKNYQSLRR